VARRTDDADPFRVPLGTDILGGVIRRWERLWVRLGDLETEMLADRLETVSIQRPVFVAGLARAGSTILLELLAAIPGVITHKYRDYPPIYTPYWWNWLLDHVPRRRPAPVERTHLDGIMVTPDSPEAMEEILWMTFFPWVHDPRRSNVLNGDTSNPAFEKFYRDHIRKLLLVRGGGRYVSKGNYNVTRFAYLLKLFPDARFVVPIRRPDGHIASLMKQQALFCRGEAQNPRVLEHMRRVGHFEFGLDRRPINTGDDALVHDVLAMWERGEEARGWARYWGSIYRHVADSLEANPALRRASLVVLFEDLCESPEPTIRSLLRHCGLEEHEDVVARFVARIGYPTYYRPNLSPQELNQIENETIAIARRFAY
jgi:hypothetical protein